MKMIVKSVITSTFDVDTKETHHATVVVATYGEDMITRRNFVLVYDAPDVIDIGIEDEDGLSEVHPDMLGAVVLGGLRASEKAVLGEFPRLAARPNAKHQPITEDEED